MKKKVFLRAYCHSNLGDDLFIHILCKRYPDVDFYISMKYEAERGLKDIPNLHVIHRRRIQKALDKAGKIVLKKPILTNLIVKKCDAVVMIGGSMFIEDETGAWRNRLRELQNLRKQTKHFFILGANFGAYHTEEFRQLHADFFASCDDICFRDYWSERLFGEQNNIRYAPDIVFCLEDVFSQKTNKEKRLTVIPIQLKQRSALREFTEEYSSKMAEVVDSALSQGWEISFLSFCEEQGDEQAIRDILDKLPSWKSKKIRCLSYNSNIREVLMEISRSELVITSRFHGMILGWVYDANVCPVIYDHKMSHIIEDIGFQGPIKYVSELNQISPNDILYIDEKVDVNYLKHEAQKHFAKIDLYLREGKDDGTKE